MRRALYGGPHLGGGRLGAMRVEPREGDGVDVAGLVKRGAVEQDRAPAHVWRQVQHLLHALPMRSTVIMALRFGRGRGGEGERERKRDTRLRATE